MQLADTISSYSQIATLGSSLILIFLVFISLITKHLSPILKRLLFMSILSVVTLVTLFLVVSTIYLNVVSVSKGPIHYHADFEIWTCGKEIKLEDPTGLSNKIGTPILHEHNDKRIHLEGVVVEEKDASLGKFFEVIGGELNADYISLPTNDGQISFTSDTACQDGQTETLQVFVYKTIRDNYYQQKLADPKNYIISPRTNIPPGDCIIIEFGPTKEKTDKLCRSFEAANIAGKLKGEVKYGN